jgi:tRNA U34 2-thiouridine synthase MnmA/TrmU
MVKAVGLFSGGLDSSLAIKLMLNQGIEVTALNFVTPFTPKGGETEARKRAREFGVPIKVIRVGRDYMGLVKNPKHGYGKQLNPCIDCRIFMFKKAKQFMKRIGASFVFTGEVLNQRPMSQKKTVMELMDKEAGLEGLVLRPLSAKLLEPTIPEKKRLVDRRKLLRLSGRERKPQMNLAGKFGISGYPAPAGGCKLTEPQFAGRVREAFEHGEDKLSDMTLLKYGRHFRLKSGARVVVGRNEGENEELSKLKGPGDLSLEVVGYMGPIVLLKDSKVKDDIEIAASICVRYSDFEGGKAKVRVNNSSIFARPMSGEKLDQLRI